MYPFLHQLLSDKKGGEIFVLFGGWHFLYILLTLAVAATVWRACDRRGGLHEKTVRFFIDLAFGMYVADLFLMPIAYGEIDIEKLPFHACTAMCVACFLSYRVRFFEKYRSSFVLLGLISNLVYLIYPAGVMWHAVHPLSYRVIQTLTFHGVMSVYGVLYLLREFRSMELGKCRCDLAVVCTMTFWALVGNYAYNGSSEGYSHFFNWFFVVRDPFHVIPEAISSYLMPLLNVVIFFALELLIRMAIWRINAGRMRKNDQREGI